MSCTEAAGLGRGRVVMPEASIQACIFLGHERRGEADDAAADLIAMDASIDEDVGPACIAAVGRVQFLAVGPDERILVAKEGFVEEAPDLARKAWGGSMLMPRPVGIKGGIILGAILCAQAFVTRFHHGTPVCS